MNNLGAHKGQRGKKPIEGRGCGLLCLPPYSPDLNPLEEAFAKVKALLRRAGARDREASMEAIGRVLDTVPPRTPGASVSTASTHCKANDGDNR